MMHSVQIYVSKGKDSYSKSSRRGGGGGGHEGISAVTGKVEKIPRFDVTNMAIADMKNRDTAEAEARRDLIEKNEQHIKELKSNRKKEGLLEDVKRDLRILEAD